MKTVEQRLSEIEARNKRVELDKAWEVSLVRRISIALLTYSVIFMFLLVIHNERPYLYAAIPVVGYLLSTLVLKTVRTLWQKNHS